MSFTSRRDLRLVITAKAVSFFGDELAMFALVLRLQANGAGAGAVAALMMANLAPIVLLSGVAGRLVDRYDNRRLLLASSLAQAAVCACLVAATAPWAVLVLVMLLGAGQSVNAAAWQALLPAVAGPGQLSRALSRLQAATTLAGIAAPALSGVLTGWLGAGPALIGDTATFLVITLVAMLLRTARAAPAPVARGERMEGGLTIVRRDPVLRTAIGMLGLFVLLGASVNVVDVFLVRQTLGAGPTWYGLAAGAFSLGVLAGALSSGRITAERSLARGMVIGAALLGAGLCAMGLAPTIGWLILFGAATGLSNGLLNVVSNSLILGRAEPSERGRVGALLGGVLSGTSLAAYASGGALAVALSPRAIFVIAGAMGMLAPLVFARTLLRAVRPQHAAPLASAEQEPLAAAARPAA